MTMNSSRTMQSATHIAFDPFTPDTLLRLGITKVVQAMDRLVIGPCRHATTPGRPGIAVPQDHDARASFGRTV